MTEQDETWLQTLSYGQRNFQTQFAYLKSVIQEKSHTTLVWKQLWENKSLVMQENIIKYTSLGSTEGQMNSHWTSHYNGAPAAINWGQGN